MMYTVRAPQLDDPQSIALDPHCPRDALCVSLAREYQHLHALDEQGSTATKSVTAAYAKTLNFSFKEGSSRLEMGIIASNAGNIRMAIFDTAIPSCMLSCSCAVASSTRRIAGPSSLGMFVKYEIFALPPQVNRDVVVSLRIEINDPCSYDGIGTARTLSLSASYVQISER